MIDQEAVNEAVDEKFKREKRRQEIYGAAKHLDFYRRAEQLVFKHTPSLTMEQASNLQYDAAVTIQGAEQAAIADERARKKTWREIGVEIRKKLFGG